MLCDSVTAILFLWSGPYFHNQIVSSLLVAQNLNLAVDKLIVRHNFLHRSGTPNALFWESNCIVVHDFDMNNQIGYKCSTYHPKINKRLSYGGSLFCGLIVFSFWNFEVFYVRIIDSYYAVGILSSFHGVVFFKWNLCMKKVFLNFIAWTCTQNF